MKRLIISDLTDHLFEQVLKLDEVVFSGPYTHLRADREKLRSVLSNKRAINIVYRDDVGAKALAYMSAVPTQELDRSYFKSDPVLERHHDVMYVEACAVDPGLRSDADKILTKLFLDLIEVARPRFRKLALHERSGEVSKAYQNNLNAIYIRTIRNWNNTNESYDYLEIDLRPRDDGPSKMVVVPGPPGSKGVLTFVEPLVVSRKPPA